MEEKQSLNTIYVVNGTGQSIRLQIIIGAIGQTATTSITIGDTIGGTITTIVENFTGGVFDDVIGTNIGLDGKTLSIVSTITDTSVDTNLTELHITLKGGPRVKKYPLLSKTVEAQGNSASYICVIDFFKP